MTRTEIAAASLALLLEEAGIQPPATPCGPGPGGAGSAGQGGLSVELIPGSLWGRNLRESLTRAEWQRCKQHAAAQSGGKCTVCGAVGHRRPVECHEVWEWHEDREPCLQKLVGLVALCPDCHAVKHFGRTNALGFGAQARKHLADVNGWTEEQADAHIAAAYADWKRRCFRVWDIDLSWVATELRLDPDSPRRRASRAGGPDGWNEHDPISDPGAYDGGYGPGSYFIHAMSKVD
jgi:hypothetical protein